jgi:hypothetical protein
VFSLTLAAALLLAAQVATEPQVPIGPQVPPEQTLRLPPLREATRLPQRPPPSTPPEPERIPIDLGPDAPTATPPETIDILAPPLAPEAANAALVKECEDLRERGIIDGEIVVCRALEVDTSQLYSGSRAAWLKDYAERTQGANTIPPPDVAGPGIFRGPPTISGLCFIGPCPKDEALIIDVEAIPPPPAGSDAERVAQGLAPLQGDDAPLSDEARTRLEAELGLPETESR